MMTRAERRVILILNTLNGIMILPLVIYCAFVASKLWQWFVEANFHTAHLTTIDFMGINLLISLFLIGVYSNHRRQEKKTTTFSEKVDRSVEFLFGRTLGISIVLLLGYIYHLFM